MRSLAILVLAALTPGLAAPRAEQPALAAVPDDGTVRLHLGSGPPDGNPTFDQVMVRSASGEWRAPTLLPFHRPGLPLAHRDMTWILENRRDSLGTQHHVLLPVTGELGFSGVRLEHVQGLAGTAAVTTIDDWTFVVAELGPESHVFVRVLTSHGSTMEMEVVREGAWKATWPADARLLATGLSGDLLVVVALAGGRVVGAMYREDLGVAVLEPVDVSEWRAVTACVTDRGPVIVGSTGGELVSRWWRSSAWGSPQRLPLPGGLDARAVAACTVDRDRTIVHASALLQGEPTTVVGALLREDGWGPLERVVVPARATTDGAIRPAPERLTPAEAEATARRLRRMRWGLVAVAFPLIAMLLWHLARLRR